MHNVDYSALSYSYPQHLPQEYMPGYSAIAVDGQCLTPPLEAPAGFPRGFAAQQPLPTPPPSPRSFAKLNPFDTRQAQRPSYTTTSNTSAQWSNYLDPSHRLQFQKVLGSGAYGVVHLAQDVTTGIHYAVKALNKFMPNGLPLDRRQQMFQQTEMRLHYKVSQHPNVVSLLRIMDTPEHTYVIMEYCPEGDLFSNITERGRYVGDDAAAKDIFLQILDAVAHCHAQGVYHRDLKPENILVTQGGRQVKLADFGLATQQEYATEFGCGSTFYMSPECQDQSSGATFYACAPNDIWSLGVILVNLTCGRNPWKSASLKDSTYRAYLEDRQFLKTILPLSDELNEILGMIFEPVPEKRIQLAELRERINNCRRFTCRPEVPCVPVYVSQPASPVTYDESAPLSQASTISDEGSMVSDHSDSSTAPSEVGSPSEELDFTTFEVMEEDCDFVNIDASSPQSKRPQTPWEAVEPVVPAVQGPAFHASLPSYVTPPATPGSEGPVFEYPQVQVQACPPPVAPFVFNSPCPLDLAVGYQPQRYHQTPHTASFIPNHHSHSYAHRAVPQPPLSQLRGSVPAPPHPHYGTSSTTRTPTWPTAGTQQKRSSHPRDNKATMRASCASQQWRYQAQLRNFLGQSHFPNGANRVC